MKKGIMGTKGNHERREENPFNICIPKAMLRRIKWKEKLGNKKERR